MLNDNEISKIIIVLDTFFDELINRTTTININMDAFYHNLFKYKSLSTKPVIQNKMAYDFKLTNFVVADLCIVFENKDSKREFNFPLYDPD
jgi:hypothetical protein